MTESQIIGSRQEGWHSLAHEDVLRALRTEPGGLADSEVRVRMARYGPNRLTPPKRRSPLKRLLMQFHNILLYVMLGAAVITASLHHWVDTGVLLAAVVINAIIGFIQEGKAEAALDAIRAMLSPHATVIRGGIRREIDATDLVPVSYTHLDVYKRQACSRRLPDRPYGQDGAYASWHHLAPPLGNVQSRRLRRQQI